LTTSDNTAINLLMKQIGGPKGVTAFARSIGDRRFRLDRWEPELNSALPGDIQDTSTPLAMATSLQRLGLESGLLNTQREQLQSWLKNNKTGDLRIRAGVPRNWIVGDKTGTCKFGTTNDIGILWPPNGLPIVLAIYFTQNEENAAPREDILASVTRIILSAMSDT
ncbi:MAG: class A beta-lactamase, partial [Gammaproteobacteria bacterium]|nr:class A beta-lactamase [Gammaproteobacteria bacterium]